MKQEAGIVIPVIDPNRCEAKAACVAVCPNDVFVIQTISAETKSQLSLRGKLKSWFHGGKQAHVAHPDDCHACGLCVPACPEQAIRLVKR